MTCQQCGKPIASQHRNTKFCSACTISRDRARKRERYHEKRKPSETKPKTCHVCGKPLASKHFNARFCAECRVLRQKESLKKYELKQKLKAEKLKAEKVEPVKPKSATELTVEAWNKKRMSYGMYVAWMEERKNENAQM